ncbi:hypothetical protein FO519_002709 [Halicephalobus sp. NKZ332]|nr:hypothetical protein FO519_002709 [Halicephalobus sp. NKZ332]
MEDCKLRSNTAKNSDFRALQDQIDPTSNFINSWTSVLPQNSTSGLDSKLENFQMPVGLPSNQTTALDAVYGSSTSTERNLTNNPYYNAVNYSNPATYNTNYSQYYQQLNSLKNPAFANYFGATTGVNPVYYGAGYGSSNLTGAFDYPYTTGGNYYGSTNRASGTNYYNSTLPYASLGLGESMTPSTSNGSNQVSPYSGAGIKSSEKNTKRSKKKKATGGLATPEPNYSRVFIWELEDLCSFFLTYRQDYSGVLGQMVDRVFRTGFQLQHLDECDQTNIEDANLDEAVHEICYNPNPNSNGQINVDSNSPENTKSENSVNPESSPHSLRVGTIANEGLQRMALRYQRIRNVYNQCKNNVEELLSLTEMSPMPISQLTDLIKQIDVYSTLESYKKCLRISTERSGTSGETYTNVILTSEPLSSAMAKLLLTGLSTFVPVENIYSSHKLGKAEVLDRILHRYKKTSIIISSNLDTNEIAKKENVPFWRIGSQKDVEVFYIALDKVLLNSA